MEDTVGSSVWRHKKFIHVPFFWHKGLNTKRIQDNREKIFGGRRAQVSAAKVNAATREMWEAVGLRNSSPRINDLFAELMRGPLLVNDRHPFQGMNLLHLMPSWPTLGQVFLPQNQYFLAAEHAEFVRAAFEDGSQTFHPSPVRTVARTVVAMLARSAGGIGKLRTLVRSQDVEGLRRALRRPMRLRQIRTLSALESTSWLTD